jgi:outer membrane protein assembly factor BamB
MALGANTTDTSRPAGRGLYRTTIATAAVSAAIGAVVAGLLVWNHLTIYSGKPLESPELADLKKAVADAPDAAARDALQAEARDLDLRLRQEYFRGLALAEDGRYVLLGCGAMLVLSVALGASLRKRLPMPGKSAGQAPPSGRPAALTRWSVAAVGVALLVAAIALLATTVRSFTGQGQAQATGKPAQVALMPTTYPSAAELQRNWPRFRGQDGLGVCRFADIPDQWDGSGDQNILWKTKETLLPGENSPVLWGNRIFMTGADKKKREVYCFDTQTGSLVWRKGIRTPAGENLPPPQLLEDTGFAAPTAVTDGQRVFAIFANADIACLDFDGREVWAINVGPLNNTYGHGTSLVMWRNLLIVMLDQGEMADISKSRMIALDTATGRTVWQKPRPVPKSWATPIVIDTGKGEQLITCGAPWVIAYDPGSGEEIWRAKCMGGDVAPSPIYAGGLVIAVMEGQKLVAIRPDGKGDVTGTHIAWMADENLPDLACPVSDGNLVWIVSSPGVVTCYDANSGKKVYEEETDEAYKSSPSLVGGLLYLTTEKGMTLIVKAGRKYELVSKCPLGEHVSASMVFQDGRIYLRGKRSLYCIGKKQEPQTRDSGPGNTPEPGAVLPNP